MATENCIRTENYSITYRALALRAKIRAAKAMLMEMDCYGDNNETGEALCDLGFVLVDADRDLGDLHKEADVMENSLPGIHRTDQQGAMAALAALRSVEKIASMQGADGNSLTMDEWWARADGAVEALQSAAGAQGEFMAGFLATLAEYLLNAMSSGGLDLYKWKPEAAMSTSEKTAKRKKFGEEVERMQSEVV